VASARAHEPRGHAAVADTQAPAALGHAPGGRRVHLIRSKAVESLYFDSVLFIYHLALALIVGGGIVLGSATAPGIFRSVRSRGEAGSIFGAVLARWDGLAIFCVILLVLTSALRVGFEITGDIEARLIV